MIRSLYEIHQKENKTVEEYMLRIYETVAILHQAHPECMSYQGKNLRRDMFYHGLLPHPCNMLGFVMVDLPKREQADTSFNTLYMLARKMEANQCMMQTMSHFQCKECWCFVCGVTGHFARDCSHQDTFC